MRNHIVTVIYCNVSRFIKFKLEITHICSKVRHAFYGTCIDIVGGSDQLSTRG